MFTAWLWLNVPASMLAYYGCPWESRRAFCERFGNTVGILFGLFPMSAEFLLSAFIGLDPLVWTCLVAATAGCHVLLRRFAPERLGLLSAALLILGWYVLTFVTLFVGLYAYFQFNLPGTVFRSTH